MKRSFPLWTAGGVVLADKIFQGIAISELMQAKDIYSYAICFYPALNDYNIINTPMRILLLLLLAGCLYIILKYCSSSKNSDLLMGVGLVAGGAFSNSISWIFQGSVVDYIGFFTPNYDLIFNLADLAYISGTLLVLLGVTREVLWMLGRIGKTGYRETKS
ncbi:MAG TPA: signal peptidase II [Bacillota bacterium]|jgi:lipoprotein signal peptidase|nr:signal peptidase II [Peptococcaceae bacterium MAG4]NLW37621.1 signal peptidase II [Peptococcaceae bacterium]HPZ42550.1 signal peptidase II [Bacillota bacterium]HQD76503.1 signal peptidase II [Bacillota bacterium]HUM58958.1 signal peptidase II [Bacillota bacterium]